MRKKISKLFSALLLILAIVFGGSNVDAIRTAKVNVYDKTLLEKMRLM